MPEEKKEAKAVVLPDPDKVEQLLDILDALANSTVYPSIKQAAMNELAQIERDLWEQLFPEQAEAEAKAQEEREKAEKENQERIKKRQEEERKRQEKLREEEEAKNPNPVPQQAPAYQPERRI